MNQHHNSESKVAVNAATNTVANGVASTRANAMTWFRLGRVSNLPTVWSNTLVGLSLGGLLAGQLPASPVLLVILALIAMSLFYIGGMFLNDAFDAVIDARERPERPIPSGEVTRQQVFVAGFGLLAAGVVLVFVTASLVTGQVIPATLAALVLGGCIVLYNVWHKQNPASPLIMGLCRMMVYVTTAWLVVPSVSAVLVSGALALLAYLIGLTAIAKQENLSNVNSLWPLGLLFLPIVIWQWAGNWNWLTLIACIALFVWVLRACRLLAERKPGNIPKAVSGMLAGISLVDALALAALATRAHDGFMLPSMTWADGILVLFCFLCFALTLLFHRVVPGT